MGKNNPMYGMKGELSPNFGKKFSKNTKKLISKAQTGENNSFFGRKHTDKTLLELSKNKRTLSDEQILKIFELYNIYKSYYKVAKIFKKDDKTIWNIINFKVKYANELVKNHEINI